MTHHPDWFKLLSNIAPHAPHEEKSPHDDHDDHHDDDHPDEHDPHDDPHDDDHCDESVFAFTLPRSEQECSRWMQNAAELISRAPARYLLDEECARELTLRAAAFEAAIVLATSPMTRSTTTIDTKNAARDAARAAFLPVIDHIRHHREIETSAKEELGMKARPRRRAPIEPPDTVPVLSLVTLGDGSHTLRYADERTPHKRARPKGAGYLDLRIIITPSGPVPPNETMTSPQGTEASRDQAIAGVPHPEGPLPAGAIERSERITRTPFTIEHDRAHAGRLAHYFGRWMTNTHKPGRWNPQPLTMTIAIIGEPPPPPAPSE